MKRLINYIKIFTFSIFLFLTIIELSYGKKVFKENEGLFGEDPDPDIREKRNFVRQMMMDSWDDYKEYCWGENELRPVNKSCWEGNYFGGSKIGATIVDSLDTLWIMGMHDELEVARNFVASLDFSIVDARVSVFECNIRFLGGFLSAYALTQDSIFKDKAEQLARLLLPAFNSPSGLPFRYLNLTSGEASNSRDDFPDPYNELPTILAEIGTLHLEWNYLSQITGDPIFKEKVDRIREIMDTIQKPNGLYWNYLNVTTGEFADSIEDDIGNQISIGVLGDSFYEYLMKAYIMLEDYQARRMYDEAIDAFVNNGLTLFSQPSDLFYIAEKEGNEVIPRMMHLAAFAGGMFALGSITDPKNPDDGNRDRDWEFGIKLTNTFRESYIKTHTQIGPEWIWFTENLEGEAATFEEKRFRLRPEVVESYMILWRLTGDKKYRDWGWEAVEAIEKYCKVEEGRGYSSIDDVYSENPQFINVQETFFLAETLKYLYLLFSSNELINLDHWVFNTEAHLLPVMGKNNAWNF